MKTITQIMNISEHSETTPAIKHQNFFFLTLTMLLSAIFLPHSTFAAGLQSSGWIDFPDSENLGDTTSCAAGENYTDYYVKAYNSEATTTAPWIGVYIFRNNNFLTAVGGPSLWKTSPVCFNPLTDVASVYIYGSNQFYDFHLPVNVATSTQVITGKILRSHIHLKPLSMVASDIEYVAPLSANSTQWINNDPVYVVNVKAFPAVHSATDVKKIVGFTLDTSWNIVKKWEIAGGGGIKTYSSAPSPLSDGVYYWASSTALNGPFPSGRPFSSTPVYFDGSGPHALYQILRVDKTLPTATPLHSPASSVEGDAVIVSGIVADAMSGLYSAQVYVDGALEKSCSYVGEPSATCSANAKVYSVGPHTYSVTAQDRASNVVTVSTGTFTVSPSVIGACSATHYACSAGTSANTVDGATTWTWSCLGSGSTGSNASCSEAKPAPTVNIWADQNPIVYNTNTIVRWTSTDATTCVAPGGLTSTSGNYTTPLLTTTTTYNLSCTGPGGTTDDSINVTIIPNLNGVCGALNGTSSATAPMPTDPGLCAYTNGTPTISGSGPWTWKCLGSGTGVDSPTCSMTKLLLSCGNTTCENLLGESVLTCPQDCRVKFRNF